MITLALLLAGEAHAATVCFRIPMIMDDNASLGTPPPDDFFQVDGSYRARGVRIVYYDDLGWHWLWTANNGCATFNPITNAGTYSVGVLSKARVNGITMHSYTYEETTAVDDEPEYEMDWFTAPMGKSVTYEVDRHVTWSNLAIAAWAFHRNTFGLGTSSARGCCTDAGAGTTSDGRCTNGVTDYNDWQNNPVWMRTTMELVNNPNSGCCASKWTPEGGVLPGIERPAMVHKRYSKYPGAHELGHAVIMKRMGWRTQNNQNAPLNHPFFPLYKECMGSWIEWELPDDPNNPLLNTQTDSRTEYPQSPGPPDFPLGLPYPWPWGGISPDQTNNEFRADRHGMDLKGPLVLEYQSTAAREGWASFYMAWLWNRRTQSDCAANDLIQMDFDLDGDMDVNYGGTEGSGFGNQSDDGFFSCETIGPALPEPFPSDPLAPWLTGRDWLDAVATNACTDPEGLANRGTNFDWQHFWWDMTTDSGVPPKTLADIYIDMCPTNWNTADAGPSQGFPAARLETSATFHGEWNAWNAQKNNGVNR